jgi:hypothetical protein
MTRISRTIGNKSSLSAVSGPIQIADPTRADTAAKCAAALRSLAALGEIALTKAPRPAFTRSIHKLGLWISGALYPLEIVDIEPANYYDPIGGWVQMLPAPFGESSIKISVKLQNNSSKPVSGTVIGYIDGHVLPATPTANVITDLLPGAEWKGTLTDLFGQASGIHKLSVVFVSSQATGAFTTYDPGSGRLTENQTYPTLSVIEQPYVVGSDRTDLRSRLTKYLGITVVQGDLKNPPFEAIGVDRNGITRHIRMTSPDEYPWDRFASVELKYWEDGHPDNTLNASILVSQGNFYEDLPDHLKTPTIKFSYTGPVDAPKQNAVLHALGVFTDEPPAPEYTYLNGKVVKRRIDFTLDVNSTYDAVNVTGSITETTDPWNQSTAQAIKLPDKVYPINSTAPLPEYNLQNSFSAILRRTSFFASILEDRMPVVPESFYLLTKQSATSAASLVVEDVATGPIDIFEGIPFLERTPQRGLPSGWKLTLWMYTAVGLRLSCIGFWPPNPLTAVCLGGALLSLLDLQLISNLDKALINVNNGIRLAPPPTRMAPGTGGGTPAGPYPGPFPPAGAGGSGGTGGDDYFDNP